MTHEQPDDTRRERDALGTPRRAADRTRRAASVDTTAAQARYIQGRIREILHDFPGLEQRYGGARRIIRAFRRPSFYEVSQRCNLWCEGCYYFEDAARKSASAEMTETAWSTFFAGERERGVSMAYLVGAEPALYPERLKAASRNIRFGKIGTNGTIRIPDEVRFRIGVSVWGNETDDAVLRGGSVLRKAMRNYAGDPRAIMLFTLSPWNLQDIDEVVQASEDHDLKLTFSMFSPTKTYLEKLDQGAPADSSYFRLGPTRARPVFSDDDLKKTSESIRRAMQRFPDTVLFSEEYCDLITKPGPLYEMNPESGLAENCGSRIREPLRYFDASGTAKQVKCCTPDVDCTHCRLYSGGWSTLFRPTQDHLAGPSSFERWLRMIETVGQIFLFPYPFEDS